MLRGEALSQGMSDDDEWVMIPERPTPPLLHVPQIVLLYLMRTFLDTHDVLALRATCRALHAIDDATWRTVMAALREARKRTHATRACDVALGVAKATAAGALALACVGGTVAAVVLSSGSPPVVSGSVTLNRLLLPTLVGTVDSGIGSASTALHQPYFDAAAVVEGEREWSAERDFDVVSNAELLEHRLRQRSDVCVAVERQRYNPVLEFWSRRMMSAVDPPAWECPQLDIVTHADAARVVSVNDLEAPGSERHFGWEWDEQWWDPSEWRYGASFLGAGPTCSFVAPHFMVRQRVWRRKARHVHKD